MTKEASLCFKAEQVSQYDPEIAYNHTLHTKQFKIPILVLVCTIIDFDLTKCVQMMI